MNIQRIEYFLITAKEKSMTQAAKKIYISHQALSRQILMLEKELNTSLFVRKNTGLELTADGLRLQKVFQPIVDTMNDAYDHFCHQIKNRQKVLNIGYFNGISFEDVVNPYLTSLVAKSPNLSIRFEADELIHLEEALEKNEQDIIITISADDQTLDQYSYETLLETTLYIYVSKKHPLYDKETLTKADLEHQTLLVHSNRPAMGKGVFAWDVKVAKRVLCKNYSTFLEYLNQGLGLAIIGDGSGLLGLNLKRFDMPEGYTNRAKIMAISNKLLTI